MPVVDSDSGRDTTTQLHESAQDASLGRLSETSSLLTSPKFAFVVQNRHFKQVE